MNDNDERKSNLIEKFEFGIHNVLGSSYLRNMYKAMAAPIPDAPRTIRNKGITITKKKEGGWIPVYQQTTGITTVSKYVVA